MKKIIAACLCACMLLLAGCGAPAPAQTPSPEPTATPEPTPTPTPTPQTSGAEVVTLEARALLTVLERGEEIEIEDEWEGYYIVNCAEGRGYVEKRLVALAGEEEAEPRTAYAKSGAEFFTGYLLRGEPERVLDTNTELQILADLGDCCLAELEGVLGYVPAEMLSDSRIQYYNYSGGGGGGGGSAPSGGADGGDISLGAQSRKAFRATGIAHPALYGTESGAAARVISATAELYAAVYKRGEQVRLLSQEDELCTLYIDGVLATVEKRCLLLEGEVPFESRTGYAASGAEVFRSLYLRGELLDSPAMNTELTLLAELGDCYLVSLPDGSMGYIAVEQVNDQPVVYNYYGGGGGGGAPSGGEWTEPAL